MAKKFTCGYCGREFDNVRGRTGCEEECFRKQEAERKRNEHEKYLADKEDRRKEVDSAREKYYDLLKKFNEDYGYTSTFTEAPFYDFFGKHKKDNTGKYWWERITW